jgi:hypothetical protein
MHDGLRGDTFAKAKSQRRSRVNFKGLIIYSGHTLGCNLKSGGRDGVSGIFRKDQTALPQCPQRV